MRQFQNHSSDALMAQVALGSEIKSSQASIAASWQRSSSFGLNPNDRPVEAVLSVNDFQETQQKSEYISQFVQPELELLYNQIAGTNFMVAYADPCGVIMDVLLDDEFRNSDAGRAVIPGSIWTEQFRGTNALGLCLHTGKSQTVAGPAHFFRKLGNVSCFAAPIYGQDNEIVGLIDATSDASSRQPHTLALVKLACKNVENRLFVDQFRNSSIISFHARHEYLSTTSTGLLAVDEYGFIDGANTNAKIMLNGLDLSGKRHFRDIFANSYASIAGRLNSNEIIRIHDAMGSAVFMVLRDPPTKKIVEINPKSSVMAPKSEEVSPHSTSALAPPTTTPQEFIYVAEDIGLKNQLTRVGRALKHNLPIFVEGARGSGKKATVRHLLRLHYPEHDVIELKCSSLTLANHKELISGDDNHQAYSDTTITNTAKNASLDGKAISLCLHNIEDLPLGVQRSLFELLDEWQEYNLSIRGSRLGGVFLSSKSPLQDLQNRQDMDQEFLESVLGGNISLPNLQQRSDFNRLSSELLREISPKHSFAAATLEQLRAQEWPGNIRQLKKTLRILVSNSETEVIRPDALASGFSVLQRQITPCTMCANSSMRAETCVLIQKTLMDSGGNISLVSRRLGISRTTIYKHIN